MDFTHFPPHDKPFKIPTYTIKLGNGLVLLKDTYILTRGDLDARWDELQYILRGKDVTGQKIEWGGKTIQLKQRLNRAPLLRINLKKMEQILAKAGFNMLEVQDNFAGCLESILFLAQKKK